MIIVIITPEQLDATADAAIEALLEELVVHARVWRFGVGVARHLRAAIVKVKKATSTVLPLNYRNLARTSYVFAGSTFFQSSSETAFGSDDTPSFFTPMSLSAVSHTIYHISRHFSILLKFP